MKKLLLLSICLQLILVFPAIEVNAGVGGIPSHHEVYLISIGVNTARFMGRAMSVAAAESDAIRFADRIKSEFSDSLRLRLHGMTLLGVHAEVDSIEAAFSYVIKQSQPEDVFIFFFAGFSSSNVDTVTGDRSIVLMSSDSQQDSNGHINRGLTSKYLKHLFYNIRAKRQLIVLDACNMREFGLDFLTATIEKDTLIASLRDRDRVILGPNGYGMEKADSNGVPHGVFTSILCSLPREFELSSGFFGDERSRLELELIKSQIKLAPETDRYCTIIFERDYLTFLNRLAGQQSSSRGVTIEEEKERKKTASLPSNRYHAVLFATDKYDGKPDWGDLRNPVFDAKAIAKELAQSYSFDTTLMLNSTKKDIESKLRTLQFTKFDSTESLLLVFSGHGCYEEKPMNMGYLVAKDSRPPTGSEIPNEKYISYNLLDQMIDNIPCNHILVVLDACFGGTFDRRLREASHRGEGDIYRGQSKEEIIAKSIPIKSRWYMASGGKEYVPDGDISRHSPFARKFLEALHSASGAGGFLTMSDIKSFLRSVFPEPRLGEFGHSDVGGDFIFVAK